MDGIRSDPDYFKWLRSVNVAPKAKKLETILKRTEGDTQFIYGDTIETNYHAWSGYERRHERKPTFQRYYDQLPEEFKAKIVVKKIEKPAS